MLTDAMVSKGRYWQKPWSLISGCTPVSEGCGHCWLRAMDHRFGKDRDTPIFREDRLNIPLKRKKPTVYSIWSDLFHEDITADRIISAFEVMQECPQHTFIVCTKRPERMGAVLYGAEGGYYLGGGDYLRNVILMTTAENQERADERIPELLKCRPFMLAVSVEPCLSRINLRLCHEYQADPADCSEHNKLDWIIAGGETGPGARPIHADWVGDLIAQCKAAGVPFFFKKWGRNPVFDSAEYPEGLTPEDEMPRELHGRIPR